MVKRKRAPGGGRKSRGEFSRLNAPISIRMPVEMRAQLRAAARAAGRSVSQELLRRVQDSFHRDRDRARDPAMRALCFLVAQLACEVSGFVTEDGIPMYDWRSVPFFFRAFKLAVGQLLDAIEPGGEIRPPTIDTIFNAEQADALNEVLFGSYQSPEARAKVAAETVLRLLHRKTTSPKMEGFDLFEPYLSAEDYGMQDARRDLRTFVRRDLSPGRHLLTRFQISRSGLKAARKGANQPALHRSPGKSQPTSPS